MALYKIECDAHAKAVFYTEAESEAEAESNLDDWLAKNDVNDLEWETDLIDAIEIDPVVDN